MGKDFSWGGRISFDFKRSLQKELKSEGPEDPGCFPPSLFELRTRGWMGVPLPGLGRQCRCPRGQPWTVAPGPLAPQQCSSASPLTALDSLRPSTEILHGQLTQSPHSPVMNTLPG